MVRKKPTKEISIAKEINPLCLFLWSLKYGNNRLRTELNPSEPNCAKRTEKDTRSFRRPISFVVSILGNRIPVVKNPMTTPIYE